MSDKGSSKLSSKGSRSYSRSYSGSGSYSGSYSRSGSRSYSQSGSRSYSRSRSRSRSPTPSRSDPGPIVDLGGPSGGDQERSRSASGNSANDNNHLEVIDTTMGPSSSGTSASPGGHLEVVDTTMGPSKQRFGTISMADRKKSLDVAALGLKFDDGGAGDYEESDYESDLDGGLEFGAPVADKEMAEIERWEALPEAAKRLKHHRRCMDAWFAGLAMLSVGFNVALLVLTIIVYRDVTQERQVLNQVEQLRFSTEAAVVSARSEVHLLRVFHDMCALEPMSQTWCNPPTCQPSSMGKVCFLASHNGEHRDQVSESVKQLEDKPGDLDVQLLTQTLTAVRQVETTLKGLPIYDPALPANQSDATSTELLNDYDLSMEHLDNLRGSSVRTYVDVLDQSEMLCQVGMGLAVGGLLGIPLLLLILLCCERREEKLQRTLAERIEEGRSIMDRVSTRGASEAGDSNLQQKKIQRKLSQSGIPRLGGRSSAIPGLDTITHFSKGNTGWDHRTQQALESNKALSNLKNSTIELRRTQATFRLLMGVSTMVNSLVMSGLFVMLLLSWLTISEDVRDSFDRSVYTADAKFYDYSSFHAFTVMATTADEQWKYRSDAYYLMFRHATDNKLVGVNRICNSNDASVLAGCQQANWYASQRAVNATKHAIDYVNIATARSANQKLRDIGKAVELLVGDWELRPPPLSGEGWTYNLDLIKEESDAEFSDNTDTVKLYILITVFSIGAALVLMLAFTVFLVRLYRKKAGLVKEIEVQHQWTMDVLLMEDETRDMIRDEARVMDCEEHLTYWEHLYEFQKTKQLLARHAKKIQRRFINNGASEMINISGNDRKQLTDAFEEHVADALDTAPCHPSCVKLLFKAQDTCMQLLYDNIYADFIRSETFKEFRETRDKQIEDHVKLMKEYGGVHPSHTEMAKVK